MAHRTQESSGLARSLVYFKRYRPGAGRRAETHRAGVGLGRGASCPPRLALLPMHHPPGPSTCSATPRLPKPHPLGLFMGACYIGVIDSSSVIGDRLGLQALPGGGGAPKLHLSDRLVVPWLPAPILRGFSKVASLRDTQVYRGFLWITESTSFPFTSVIT